MRISTLLFGDAPAVFPTDLSMDEAVQQLSAGVSPFKGLSVLRSHEGKRVFGSVTPKRVRLFWVTPFVSNVVRPRFVGRFVVEEGKVVLMGKFGVVLAAKLWACAIAVTGLVGIVITSVNQAANRPGFEHALPKAIAVSLAGFAAIHLSQWLTRSIRRNLAAHIASALASSGEA